MLGPLCSDDDIVSMATSAADDEELIGGGPEAPGTETADPRTAVGSAVNKTIHITARRIRVTSPLLLRILVFAGIIIDK